MIPNNLLILTQLQNLIRNQYLTPSTRNQKIHLDYQTFAHIDSMLLMTFDAFCKIYNLNCNHETEFHFHSSAV